MPYTKVKNHPQCAGRKSIGVTNKKTGKLMGCHANDEAADKQIAALMAKESDQERSSMDRWIDNYSAQQVVAGEMVRILPMMEDGYHRWGQQRGPIDHNALSTLASNWDSRASIPGIVSRIPLTVEHEDVLGRIGTVAGIDVRPDGLYAEFELTERGKDLLEGGDFSYLSPEIDWDFRDIADGSKHGPVMVGVSVTNFPFFGDMTAMYSDRAADSMAERFSASFDKGVQTGLDLYDVVTDAVELVKSIGWSPLDLDFGDGAVLDLPEEYRNELAWINQMAKRRGPARVLGFTCRGRKEGEAYYPRSAWLVNDGDPVDWQFRIKQYVDGILSFSTRLITEVAAEASDPNKWEALEGHREFFERFGVSLPDPRSAQKKRQEVTKMAKGANGGQPPDGGNQPGNERGAETMTVESVSVEEFRTLEKNFEQLTAASAAKEAEIAQMKRERVMDRFSREAEEYSALGLEIDEYAKHFAWLASADKDGEHLEWFQAQFATADSALARSNGAGEVGTSEPPPEGDSLSEVEREVQKMAQERKVAAVPGTEEYNQLVAEAFAADPALYARYRKSLIGR